MKLFTCTVRLAGNVLNTVDLSPVTVPEMAVLIAVHGQGSIVNVREAGEDVVTRSALLEQLREKYNRTTSKELVVDKCFPGLHPTLPLTLAEIGLSLTDAPVPVPVPNEPDLEEEEVEQVAEAS